MKALKSVLALLIAVLLLSKVVVWLALMPPKKHTVVSPLVPLGRLMNFTGSTRVCHTSHVASSISVPLVTAAQIAEGFDTLEKIDTAFVDEEGRPLQNIRSVCVLPACLIQFT